MKKTRIDNLLIELNFADSLKKAQALVMSGIVLVNEQQVIKPSQKFSSDVKIRLKGAAQETKYVGRGGIKLEKALSEFHICPDAYTCLDVGSSTGGFTDCLLQNGAAKVYAVDSGTNQLAWKIRNDKRVAVYENTNARYLKPIDFDTEFDLIVVDVSFISVTKIIPALKDLLDKKGKLVILIKPQFEVDKEDVESGGVIRDSEKHEKVIRNITIFAENAGLKLVQIIDSPILGASGNKEFLALYEKTK